MKDIFIKTENLYFAYEAENDGAETLDAPAVLKNINVEIERGSFVAVLGHNGSGKSTFAKLLNLILRPTAGRILVEGEDITRADMTEDDIFAIRRKIGMVFQNPDNQLVSSVVEEDVAFGPENLGVEPEEIRRRVDAALQVVGMTEFARHSPHQLSGGQKQKVAIAGVIAMLPACIIFDESTAMLDPLGRADVLKTIRMLNKEKGITVLHITHNMNEAVLADRVLVMDDGVIALDGTPKEVFKYVDELKAMGLGVPQVTELMYELSKSGISIPETMISEEEGAKLALALINQ
ncbi:MAG: energy-coupling factor transporter ATPase [Clostridiales bacterium]|nr:energy-coupling factor transporter ATPase [Clostridiales bacterium]